MILSKSIETLPESAVKLSLTIGKEKTKSSYDNLLQEYSKKAHIKGFRPGKVPASVLVAKFGESLKMETAQAVIEDALKLVFEDIEEKPLPYAQPQISDEIKFIPGEDFAFSVKYDVMPKVSVKNYKGLTINEPQVTVGKEDLDRELDAIREKNAIVLDAPEGAKVAKNDTVTMNFVEVDSTGNDVENTKRQDFSFTVGKNENYYQFDDEILDCVKDKETIIKKKYADDFEHKDLAGKTVNFKVTVSRIRKKDLPALDDELAQDVDSSFKTLDDLKKSIKEKLETTAKDKVRQKNINSLMEQISASTSFELPASMVQAQLYSQYERMLGQLGNNENTLFQLLAAQGKTPQDMLNDWKPGVEKTLRQQLVVRELLKLENIVIGEAEIEAELASMAALSNSPIDEVKKYYQENNMKEYLEQDIAEKKLFDILLAASTIKKGDKVKFNELQK